MVPHSRTSLRPDQLRPLNVPRPVEAICDEQGHPAEVHWRKRQERVIAIADRWRVEDEWWRQLICRTYYIVELEESGLFTLYRDHETGAWYRQWEAPRRPSVPWGDGNRVR